jgi:DNA invertase Pin-like site-specific DNA recombinase
MISNSKSKNIAYIRVSADKQDLANQRNIILEYAHKQNLKIDRFLEVEISFKQSTKDRKIDELLETLKTGDTILVTEVSKMARNMLQFLNIMEGLNKRQIKVTFVNQLQLSTTGEHSQLLLTIYGYFAELERGFISTRTKQALSALKAKGIKLGRPFGSGKSKLDPYRSEIEALLKNGSTRKYIAQKYGLTVQSLGKWIEKHKIDAKPSY